MNQLAPGAGITESAGPGSLDHKRRAVMTVIQIRGTGHCDGEQINRDHSVCQVVQKAAAKGGGRVLMKYRSPGGGGDFCEAEVELAASVQRVTD